MSETIVFTDKEIHILYDVLVGGGCANTGQRVAYNKAFKKIEKADTRMHNRNKKRVQE